MQDQNIKSAVINELLRIGCFIIYYLLLIVIGIAIIVGAFWGSYYVICALPSVESVRTIIFAVLSVIGLCLLAILLGVYLVKPLFAFKRNRKESRVEVTESECPKLYAMIRDVASETHCAMPKRVFLSPDVNACVFYNTSFWSIFFPVRKNLEIGLGLFDGTSADEVKSVIAHEFGHFSQNSMKVGSIVYVTNTVLYDLIYSDDFWDRWLKNWCDLSGSDIIRFFGHLTRWLTNLIKRLTFCVYEFVQKGYLKLSRYMEYDADNISCQCVGSANFVSALCKIQILSYKDELYKQIISSLIEENKIVSNYFDAKNLIMGLLPSKKVPGLKYDEQFAAPIRTFNIESRVKFEDLWASHPSLEYRLENARRLNVSGDNAVQCIPALSLISPEIIDKVSANFLSIIKKNSKEQLVCVSDDELINWLHSHHKDYFDDANIDVRQFFGQGFFQFNIEKAMDIPAPEKSPFTNDNATKIARLWSDINDWHILNQVKDGEIEASEVVVDGVIYKCGDVPIDKFRGEMDNLHNEVLKIYADIFAYVNNQCNDEKKSHFHLGFVAVFYARQIRKELLLELIAHRDNLYQHLCQETRKYEINQLCEEVCLYERHLKHVINNLDLEWIASAGASEEYVARLKEYTKVEHNSCTSMNTDTINIMFQITDSLHDMANSMEESANHLICDIAKEIIDRPNYN